MSIYSANRSGSMATAPIVANESYGVSDLGRILYESQCNDMTLFEAIVASDLNEMKAVSEGTLLLSEAEEGNKKSFKAIIESLKTKILEWLKKIKGAFQAAIRKISAYILGDNKAFVANFKAVYDKKVGKGKSFSGEIKTTIYDVDALKGTIPSADEIRGIVADNKDADNVNKQEIVKAAFTKALGEEVTSPKDYKDKAAKKYSSEMGCAANDINFYLELLENASESIKALRTLEKEITNKVNEMVSVLKKAEQEAKSVDKDKSHGQAVRNLTATVGAFETVVGVMVATGIGMVKTNVKNSRVALRKVLSQMNGDEATVAHEAAVIDGDDVEAALTDAPVEVPMDAETAAAVEDAIATADAE